MKTIHKFELFLIDRNTIKIPVGAQILTVQTQKDALQIWAIINTEAKKEDRVFEVSGTGIELLPLNGSQRRVYLGTAQSKAMVWHVFEIVNQ